MLAAGVPSFCLLCQSYAIREIEAGADHEAQAAEHVEDAAPDVGCEWHRYAWNRGCPHAILIVFKWLYAS